VRYHEFEASARLPLPSDELFELASDPQRLGRWLPSDLAPHEPRSHWTHPVLTSPTERAIHRGVRGSRDQRRLEWCTIADGCHIALQIRPAGRDSDVTIHLWAPDQANGQSPLALQLQQALRRLQGLAADALVAFS